MVNTKYLAKEPVEKARGQNSLPKTDEVEGERYEKAEELFAIFGNNFLRDRVIVQYFCSILHR